MTWPLEAFLAVLHFVPQQERNTHKPDDLTLVLPVPPADSTESNPTQGVKVIALLHSNKCWR